MMERRSLDFRDFDELLAEVDQLAASGYGRTGQWNLGMILDHVGTGVRTAMDGFPRRAPWLFRRLVGPLYKAHLFKTRKMKPGIKVPGWWLPQASDEDQRQVDQFKRTIARFRAFKGPYHEHPFMGRLTGADWETLILLHAAHHLSFLVPGEKPAESRTS